MSTVHEVVAARHCGIKVLSFSLITNICEIHDDDDDDDDDDADDDECDKCIGGEKFDPIVDEVNRVIADKGPILKKFVATALKYIEDQA